MNTNTIKQVIENKGMIIQVACDFIKEPNKYI